MEGVTEEHCGRWWEAGLCGGTEKRDSADSSLETLLLRSSFACLETLWNPSELSPNYPDEERAPFCLL